MPGTVTGSLWGDLMVGLLGSAMGLVGLAMLLGWKPPYYHRVPVSAAAVGGLLLALGMGLASYFGHPDLLERILRSLQGS